MLPDVVLSTVRTIHGALFPAGAPEFEAPAPGEAPYERVDVVVRPSHQGAWRRTLAATMDLRRAAPRVHVDVGVLDSGGGSAVSLVVSDGGLSARVSRLVGDDGRDVVLATAAKHVDAGARLSATVGHALPGESSFGEVRGELLGRDHCVALAVGRAGGRPVVVATGDVRARPVEGLVVSASLGSAAGGALEYCVLRSMSFVSAADCLYF